MKIIFCSLCCRILPGYLVVATVVGAVVPVASLVVVYFIQVDRMWAGVTMFGLQGGTAMDIFGIKVRRSSCGHVPRRATGPCTRTANVT